MNELVYKSDKGNSITNSRLVAEKFEKEHKSVLRAIDNLECSEDFRARNFALLISNNLHPSPIIQEREYAMTRDGFSFLAMGFTGAKAAKFKEDFINAFNQMEQSLKAQLPSNYLEALKALVAKEEDNQLQAAKIKELAPKAEVYDQISNAAGLKTVKEVAKELGTGEKRFFAWMREQHILMRTNIPYQKYLDDGYFEVKSRPIPTLNQSYSQTYFTSRGEVWITRIYSKCHEMSLIKL